MRLFPCLQKSVSTVLSAGKEPKESPTDAGAMHIIIHSNALGGFPTAREDQLPGRKIKSPKGKVGGRSEGEDESKNAFSGESKKEEDEGSGEGGQGHQSRDLKQAEEEEEYFTSREAPANRIDEGGRGKSGEKGSLEEKKDWSAAEGENGRSEGRRSEGTEEEKNDSLERQRSAPGSENVDTVSEEAARIRDGSTEARAYRNSGIMRARGGEQQQQQQQQPHVLGGSQFSPPLASSSGLVQSRSVAPTSDLLLQQQQLGMPAAALPAAAGGGGQIVQGVPAGLHPNHLVPSSHLSNLLQPQVQPQQQGFLPPPQAQLGGVLALQNRAAPALDPSGGRGKKESAGGGGLTDRRGFNRGTGPLPPPQPNQDILVEAEGGSNRAEVVEGEEENNANTGANNKKRRRRKKRRKKKRKLRDRQHFYHNVSCCCDC